MIESHQLKEMLAREREREIERTVRHGLRRRKRGAAGRTTRHVNDR